MNTRPTMTTNVLLVATATHWYGAARMARSLAEADFVVSLLTPANSPAEVSRFVTNVGHLGANTTSLEWVYAFAAMVKATSPRLVLPCDDTAVRLMQALVLTPPDNLKPELRLQLGALIAESLGAPAGYRASIDKAMFSSAAEALGIRVPAHAVVSDPAEAERFAMQHGYPVVLKRSHSSAGHGVVFCADGAALSREFATLAQPDPLGLGDARDGQLLVQAFVPGRIHYHNSVAWQGVLLAGQASQQLAATAKGPASAVRYYHSPTLRAMSASLAAGFGISGIYVPEFVVHEATGEAYVLEVNRRMTHGTHRGAAFNVNLGAALYAAVNGLPSTTRADLDPGEEHITVHFPLEWTRDPESRYLREYPVDVPWDEPLLVEAILAQAMASFRSVQT
jgi:predicted ATP-grasp superfamily ATP-dependent carboligase